MFASNQNVVAILGRYKNTLSTNLLNTSFSKHSNISTMPSIEDMRYTYTQSIRNFTPGKIHKALQHLNNKPKLAMDFPKSDVIRMQSDYIVYLLIYPFSNNRPNRFLSSQLHSKACHSQIFPEC